jgi:hypothetical protein
MRYKLDELPKERIKTVFALLPISLNGETVWLEKARVLQRREIMGNFYLWTDIRFIDKEKQ